MAPSVVVEQQVQVDSKAKTLAETGLKSEDAVCSINLENNALIQLSAKECGKDDKSQASGISAQPLISQKKGFSVYFITHKSAMLICHSAY